DHHHVAIIDDLPLLADPPMSGYDLRAVIGVVVDQGCRGNRQLQQVVQSGDLTLDAAAMLQVDHRKMIQVEDISGSNDIGFAEHHEAVAVGVGRGFIAGNDRLAVDDEAVLRAHISLGRPATVGKSRCLCHACQHGAVRHDGCARAQRWVVQALASRGDGRISTGGPRISIGIDDVANRQRRYLPDGRQQTVSPIRRARVDEHNADLNDDVTPITGDHVDVLCNGHYLQITVARLRGVGRDQAQHPERHYGEHAAHGSVDDRSRCLRHVSPFQYLSGRSLSPTVDERDRSVAAAPHGPAQLAVTRKMHRYQSVRSTKAHCSTDSMRSETHLSQIQKTFNCCRYFRGLVLLGCAARASERTAIYMGGKYSGMMARMDTFQAQWPNVLDSNCTSGSGPRE